MSKQAKRGEQRGLGGLSDRDYEQLADVVASMFAPATVEDTLSQIVGLAATAVDGCEAAGIMRVDPDRVTTEAASSSLVDEIDQLQIDALKGPCVDAARQRTTVYVHDLVDDSRWPSFAPPAVERGIRTVLA